MNHRVRCYPLSGSTQTIGPNNAQVGTEVYYYGGIVKMASGSIIVTDSGGGVVDQIVATATAAGHTWYGPNGVLAMGPLTVTVTGTVAGSLYWG